MAIRIAFVGFRHAHVMDMYTRASAWEEFDVVAACEEDADTKEHLREAGRVKITHDSYTQMLDEVECDAIAVGDYYAKRGSIIIRALERGKHAISDKPICTDLAELERIKALSAGKRLSVGCMLDMRDNGHFIRLRELVQQGEIGEVHAVDFGGQHPLLLGTRPHWYFEEGKHGGTINDIAIHAFDLIPWVTGLRFSTVTAARTWNAFAKEYPHFKDGAQFMAELENGAGVMGDVSYFMPDSLGYALPQYWRMTFFGRDGIIETSSHTDITLAKNGHTGVEVISPAESNSGGYLRSFYEEVTTGRTDGLSTEDVLRASHVALTVQAAGDKGLFGVKI